MRFNTDQGRKVHTTQITCRKYSGEVARLDGSQTARLLCDVSVSEVVQEIGSIEVTWRKAYPRVNCVLQIGLTPLLDKHLAGYR